MHMAQAKGILSAGGGMNLYRGCSHGCIYCDARSRCYQINHNFEDIEVKQNALELLEKELKRKRKKGMLSTGAMTDPYLPLEDRLCHMRGALLLAEQYGFGVAVLTKSSRILRDLDILSRINRKTRCVVQMTLTTYDEDLCRKIEPNVSSTRERAETLKILHEAGIPTVVWLSPILPFINDTEENIRGILELCSSAGVYGVICFGMGLTLREGNREYFYKQLDLLFPGMKERYIRTFGFRYECNSPDNEKLMRIFHETCREKGMESDIGKNFSFLSRFEDSFAGEQLSLFHL